jgi:hypothetical protein
VLCFVSQTGEKVNGWIGLQTPGPRAWHFAGARYFQKAGRVFSLALEGRLDEVAAEVGYFIAEFASSILHPEGAWQAIMEALKRSTETGLERCRPAAFLEKAA